uniref:Uncharacterized protein n=1 Tax=Seriola dumerili TaxID=41447 RepID=A0A3B4UR64_SERDU
MWCFSQVKGAIDEDVAEGMWLTLARRGLVSFLPLPPLTLPQSIR